MMDQPNDCRLIAAQAARLIALEAENEALRSRLAEVWVVVEAAREALKAMDEAEALTMSEDVYTCPGCARYCSDIRERGHREDCDLTNARGFLRAALSTPATDSKEER